MNLPISSQSEAPVSEEDVTSKDTFSSKNFFWVPTTVLEIGTSASDWEYIDKIFVSVTEMYLEKTEKINKYLQ